LAESQDQGDDDLEPMFLVLIEGVLVIFGSRHMVVNN
jgi:hypothetical protein